MRDFTFRSYKKLLDAIGEAGYSFQTVENYLSAPGEKVAILRHDVDSWPFNAMQMAQLEAEASISSTYYFRITPLSYNERAIRKIADLKHEIGYHYEDLTSYNGDFDQAIRSFQQNLDTFRAFYPVKTIAMHGKPLSRWNNLDLWQKHDYHEYELIGEPYLSIDFNQVLYLTDTGNCWDGFRYSIRDEVQSNYKYNIHSTDDLMASLVAGILPGQIMLNIHPARWNDNLLKWIVRYYILSVPKYQIKKWVKRWRKH